MESSQEAKLPDYYSDLFTGQVLVGNDALDAHIDAGGNPADIHKLEDIIHSTDLHISVPAPEFDTSDWQKQDYTDSMTWLSKIAQKNGHPFLNKYVIKNARRLGIAPGLRQLVRRNEGRLSNVYRELNLSNVRRRFAYDRTTVEDDLAHVTQLFYQNDGKTLVERIEEAARDGKGRSVTQLKARYISVGVLLEMGGIYTRSVLNKWERDDFLQWGVRYMFANGGDEPHTPGIEYLSSSARGPSRRLIRLRFGSLEAFREAVRPEYQAELELRKLEKEDKLSDIEIGTARGLYPKDLFDGCSSEDEMIAVAARYKTVKTLLPQLTADSLIRMCYTKDPLRILNSLQRHDRRVSLAIFETRATELQVFDDMFPPEESYLEYMKFSQAA
jgi:hypothetical protein